MWSNILPLIAFPVLLKAEENFYDCGSVIKGLHKNFRKTEIRTREFFMRVFLFFKEVAAVFYSKNFNYGQGAYPANQKCNWTIEATSNDEHIVLLFADYFGLEGGGRYCMTHTALLTFE